jgi:Zn-dependent protease with chaperone function
VQAAALAGLRDVRWRFDLLFLSGMLCAACGPISKLPPLASDDIEAERRKQQIDQIRDYVAQRSRLNNVAFRIRAANRDDCKNRSWAQIGLEAGTIESLPRKYRSFAHEALAVSWTQATVLSVADRSPAAIAGIRPGDHLLTFNNEAVPRSDTARWIGDFVRNSGERPIQVLVRREGTEQMRTVTPVVACAILIELITDAALNAFTTGDKIVVHSSLLRIANTDAQLAMIVGHELAHVTLGHLEKQRANRLLGWAGGAIIDVGITLGGIPTGGAFAREFTRAGELAFSVAFEREADYVGAYYAARAGYDLAGAEEFWRAFSLESPDSIRLATTHPVTPVRFVQIQEVVAEIADKRRRNAPLVPELKVSEAETEVTNPAETVR